MLSLEIVYNCLLNNFKMEKIQHSVFPCGGVAPSFRL